MLFSTPFFAQSKYGLFQCPRAKGGVFFVCFPISVQNFLNVRGAMQGKFKVF